MNEKVNKCRINAYISKKNYLAIDGLMKKDELISMKLSKGAILDLALTCFFKSLDVGESLESMAIHHLERIEQYNEDELLNSEGDDV